MTDATKSDAVAANAVQSVGDELEAGLRPPQQVERDLGGSLEEIVVNAPPAESAAAQQPSTAMHDVALDDPKEPPHGASLAETPAAPSSAPEPPAAVAGEGGAEWHGDDDMGA